MRERESLIKPKKATSKKPKKATPCLQCPLPFPPSLSLVSCSQPYGMKNKPNKKGKKWISKIILKLIGVLVVMVLERE